MNELDALLKHSFDEIKGSELIITLLKLSKELLGLPESDCEKEHFNYYQKLKLIKPDTMEQKQNYLDKKYILRGTTLLYYNSTHFNNDTLTDSIAEKAIKKFPRLIGLFLNEQEMNVLKVREAARGAVSAAEADVNAGLNADPVEELLADGKFDEAKALRDELTGKEKGTATKKINVAEKDAEVDQEPDKRKDAENEDSE